MHAAIQILIHFVCGFDSFITPRTLKFSQTTLILNLGRKRRKERSHYYFSRPRFFRSSIKYQIASSHCNLFFYPLPYDAHGFTLRKPVSWHAANFFSSLVRSIMLCRPPWTSYGSNDRLKGEVGWREKKKHWIARCCVCCGLCLLRRSKNWSERKKPVHTIWLNLTLTSLIRVCVCVFFLLFDNRWAAWDSLEVKETSSEESRDVEKKCILNMFLCVWLCVSVS